MYRMLWIVCACMVLHTVSCRCGLAARDRWPCGHDEARACLTQTPLPPVLGTLEAILAGRPGDVLIIDQGGRTDVNSFGGVAAFTAITHGFVGTMIDGVTRDVDEMQAQGFRRLRPGCDSAIDSPSLCLRWP